jgi:penicillin-binding protein-related factor A (putative recombinase)
VAKNKESLLFNRIKTALKSAYLLRIETSTARGVADVYCIYKGQSFWIELKANDSNNLQLSGYQLNWHDTLNKHGGQSFILVKTLKQRGLKIYGLEARGLKLLHQCNDTSSGLLEAFEFMHAYTLKDIDK